MSDKQLGLFDEQVDVQASVRNISDWPDIDRFPHNFGSRQVEEVVLKDLAGSASPLSLPALPPSIMSLIFLPTFQLNLQKNSGF